MLFARPAARLTTESLLSFPPQMPYSDAELRLRNTVIALYDCKAEAPDELEFDRGDVIVLTRRDPAADWWEGHLHGEVRSELPALSGVWAD